MAGNEDCVGGAHHCPHCGAIYHTGEGEYPGPGYMYETHLLFECPDPDKMERAWLDASPKEKTEVWPDA